MPKVEKIHFPGAGGERLAGILDWPDEAPRAFAIYAHCFTCTKDVKAAYWTGRTLAAEGVAVLRFDFSGLGESGGDFSRSSFSSNLEDLVAAAAYLGQHHRAPRLLVGHSLGGAAVLAVAARIPTVAAVITLAAPMSPDHLRRHLTADAGAGGQVALTVAGRRFSMGQQFVDDLARHDMEQAIADLGRALLVIHSTSDGVVAMDQAEAIFAAARQPKSFVALEGVDHLMSDRQDAIRVGRLMATWAAPYLEGSSPK